MAKVIVFPSFNEFDNLKVLIPRLISAINLEDIILVCDDSEYGQRNEISKFLTKFKQVHHLPGNLKGGRGRAVRRGFEWVLNHNQNKFTHVIEADCDGSHRMEDIKILLNYDDKEDLVIGSRYLPKSKIIGWSVSRKLFSRILNFIIPRILNLEVKDITNGLRRYSINACRLLVEKRQNSDGFIYLSEQLMVLKESGIAAQEIPIVFESRLHGKSSVGINELLKALKEVFKLFAIKKDL